MPKFRIEYVDPSDQQWKAEELSFEDDKPNQITARQWAEDWAYSAADKGSYTIKEII